MKNCANARCPNPLPDTSRVNKRYCSGTCRVAAHRDAARRGAVGGRSRRAQVLAELQRQRQAAGQRPLVLDPHLAALAALAAARRLVNELELAEAAAPRSTKLVAAAPTLASEMDAEQIAQATHIGIAGARGPSREAVLCVVLGRRTTGKES